MFDGTFSHKKEQQLLFQESSLDDFTFRYETAISWEFQVKEFKRDMLLLFLESSVTTFKSLFSLEMVNLLWLKNECEVCMTGEADFFAFWMIDNTMMKKGLIDN